MRCERAGRICGSDRRAYLIIVMLRSFSQDEFLPPDALARLQRQRLGRLLERVRATNAFYQGKLASIAFNADRDPLSVLPFTTRAELQQDQNDHPPFGTNLSFPLDQYIR